VFLLVNLITSSEIAVAAALVACPTAYGIVSCVSLFRAFGQAGAELSAKAS
jgi:hypothetical protein